MFDAQSCSVLLLLPSKLPRQCGSCCRRPTPRSRQGMWGQWPSPTARQGNRQREACSCAWQRAGGWKNSCSSSPALLLLQRVAAALPSSIVILLDAGRLFSLTAFVTRKYVHTRRTAENKRQSQAATAEPIKLRSYQAKVCACDTLTIPPAAHLVKLAVHEDHRLGEHQAAVKSGAASPCTASPHLAAAAQAVDAIQAAGGARNWVVAAPTNSGKTAIFIEVARQVGSQGGVALATGRSAAGNSVIPPCRCYHPHLCCLPPPPPPRLTTCAVMLLLLAPPAHACILHAGACCAPTRRPRLWLWCPRCPWRPSRPRPSRPCVARPRSSWLSTSHTQEVSTSNLNQLNLSSILPANGSCSLSGLEGHVCSFTLTQLPTPRCLPG